MNRSFIATYTSILALVAFGSYHLGRSSSAKSSPEERKSIASKADPSSQPNTLLKALDAISPLEAAIASDDLVATDEENFSWKTFLDEMGPTEAPLLFEELLAMDPSSKRTAIMRRFFSRWGELDGAAALENAKRVSGRLRTYLVSDAAGGWAKVDPIGAWDSLMTASNFGAIKNVPLHPAMNAIMESNPALALELAEGANTDGVKESYLRALLEVARKNGDFHSAYQTLASSESMKGNSEYMDRLFQSWGRTDFDAAMGAMDGITDPRLLSASLAGAMKGWAATDALGAFDYAMENSDDPIFANSLRSVASLLARSSTAEEISYLFDEIQDPSQKEKLAKVILPQLAKADPDTALDWASSIEDRRIRAQGLKDVMRTWAQEDYNGVKDKLQSGELEGSLQRNAFNALASEAKQNRAGLSEIVDLAASISDPEAREKTLSDIAQSSRPKKDQAGSASRRKALLSAVQSSPTLTEEEKQSVIRQSRPKTQDAKKK